MYYNCIFYFGSNQSENTSQYPLASPYKPSLFYENIHHFLRQLPQVGITNNLFHILLILTGLFLHLVIFRLKISAALRYLQNSMLATPKMPRKYFSLGLVLQRVSTSTTIYFPCQWMLFSLPLRRMA